MRIWSAVFLLLVLAVSSASAVTWQVAEAETGADGVQRLELVADSYFFRPNYLVVRAGAPVELTIRRQSWLVPHDFVLKVPEAGIDIEQEIGTGGSTVRFDPPAPGKYPFHCGKRLLFFESHRDKGMEGILEVRP